MIRPCTVEDLDAIVEVIADAARAYKGAIPDAFWHEPYMPRDVVESEIAAGVRFWAYTDDRGDIIGVMGLQYVDDATLIRHAYVRTSSQGRGIGGALMQFLVPHARGRLLVGTWQAARWAIGFYQKHAFRLVSGERKNALLDRYWTIPQSQRDVSVVLAHEP